ncbi:DUF3892 domain-containing protein [Leuconostoc mesenteroides]
MTQSKWADFLVCEVHHGDDPDIIKSIKVKLDFIENISGYKFEFTKAGAIKAIKGGYTFETIIWNEKSNKYSEGSVVDIIKIDGKEFIRTDRNATEKDNLDKLPEY